MKTTKEVLAYVFVMLFMILYPVFARGDGGVGYARIDRSSTEQSGELDGNEQQRIAEHTGYGEFLVGTAKIWTKDDGSPLVQCRLFSVYLPGDAVLKNQPCKRILHDGRKTRGGLVLGSDAELIGYCLNLFGGRVLDEKALFRQMPGMVVATVYANRATVCSTELRSFSDIDLAGIFAGTPAENIELKSLGH